LIDLELLDSFDEFVIHNVLFGVFPEILDLLSIDSLSFNILIFVEDVAHPLHNGRCGEGRRREGAQLNHIVLCDFFESLGSVLK
jgi:hypothetical protein